MNVKMGLNKKCKNRVKFSFCSFRCYFMYTVHCLTGGSLPIDRLQYCFLSLIFMMKSYLFLWATTFQTAIVLSISSSAWLFVGPYFRLLYTLTLPLRFLFFPQSLVFCSCSTSNFLIAFECQLRFRKEEKHSKKESDWIRRREIVW